MTDSHTHSGICLPTLLTVVFVTLKLLGKITWSWWWIVSPIWIPLAVLFIVAVSYGVVEAIIESRDSQL